MTKVTIKDIASRVNVSPKTVSKALNDLPEVSDELREKIKTVAREMNYISNRFAQSLISGKPSRTIGVIIDHTSPAYALILRGLEERAAEQDFNIILCNSKNDVVREKKFVNMLLEKQVDGILIRPVDHHDTIYNLEILKKIKLPYVIINRSIPKHEHSCIRADSFSSAYQATQYLIRKGHQNFIHITYKFQNRSVKDRITGMKQALKEADLVFEKKNVYALDNATAQTAYTSMLRILKERGDFTAIFAYNDVMAYGAMKAVYECRLRIPSDVAIIGVDNLMFSDFCLVPLTTVNQNLYGIGKIAMDFLLKKVDGKDTSDKYEIPKPYVIERESV